MFNGKASYYSQRGVFWDADAYVLTSKEHLDSSRDSTGAPRRGNHGVCKRRNSFMFTILSMDGVKDVCGTI